MFNPINPINANTSVIHPNVPVDDSSDDFEDDDELFSESYPSSPALNFLRNYNDDFRGSAPTRFRDDTIKQTLSCLIGMLKPNALLVGAAGVGKTRIVEDIARRLAADEPTLPKQLSGYTVYELPLANIVSGSGLIGDLESKVKTIIEFAENSDNKVILFIDEVHMLISGNQVYDKIAQILKPALARGRMKVIAATTLQESQNLLNDPAFNRRFTRILVDELSKAQTRAILEDLVPALSKHYHSVALSDKILDDVIAVSDEYKTLGSHRPDNAITLLDRAMADALINATTRGNKKSVLSKEQIIATAMRTITGNSLRTEFDIDKLADRLGVIKGQNKAIGEMLDIIERDSLGLFPRTRPLTFLFAGSSGVGKSETAKILAGELTGTKPIILNMTEYHNSASINRIIGSPVGYIGSDSKAELPFDILESNPYQVIILDEFEKCDKSVQRLFMSAFDEGYIKTAKGKTIDFSKSIIIATTNAGYVNRSETIGFKCSDYTEAVSLSDLSEFFDIELLNRFSKVLHFNSISESGYCEILADCYRRAVQSVRENCPQYAFLPESLDSGTLRMLADQSYVRQFGARPARTTIIKYIEDLILHQRKIKAASA